MSQPHGTNIPRQRTSSDPAERRKPTRAEIRQRIYSADLRDALDEFRGLRHFDRVLVGA